MSSASIRAAAAGAPGGERGLAPGRDRGLAPGRPRGRTQARQSRRAPRWLRAAASAAIPVLAALTALAGVATAGPAAAQVAGRGGTAGPASAPRLLTASWGENFNGQLGRSTQGTFSATPGPVGVPAGMTVARIAGGCDHGLAATTAGQVLTWGANDDGQLGNGKQSSTSDPTPRPITLPAGARVTSVVAGCFFSLALTTAGQVLAWGENASGQLGQGKTGGPITSPVRVQLPAGVRVTAISAGDDFGLALTAGGQVYAWGDNGEGQLGRGTFGGSSGTPQLVTLHRGIRLTRIATGEADALALTSTGRVLAWGINMNGELGNGSTDPGSLPQPVPLPAGARAIGVTGGGRHSVALLSNGQLLAWGDNFAGQLGDGSTTDRSRPVPVQLPAGVRVRAVAAGDFHTVAITATGQVLGWGWNHSGQVGDGSTVNRLTPVPVPLDVPTAKRPHAPGPGTIALVIGIGPDSDSSYVVYRTFG